MGFWREADAQAAREYGARYWRWFAAARVLRAIWPALAIVAGVGVIVLAWRGTVAAVDALRGIEIGRPILWTLAAVAAITVIALAALGAVRHLTGPPRRRRRFR
jgi:hypothetical protein